MATHSGEDQPRREAISHLDSSSNVLYLFSPVKIDGGPTGGWSSIHRRLAPGGLFRKSQG
jgi:hypothetical protein